MLIRLNNFIDKIREVEANIYVSKARWIYHQDKFKHIDKKKIPFRSTQKIETVLKRLNEDFRQFDTSKIDQNTKTKLNWLIQTVQQKVRDYKNRHGKVYLFFSRLFFGDIDKISKNFINHLENLRSRYRPEIDDQKQIEVIKPDIFEPLKPFPLKVDPLPQPVVQYPPVSIDPPSIPIVDPPSIPIVDPPSIPIVNIPVEPYKPISFPPIPPIPPKLPLKLLQPPPQQKKIHQPKPLNEASMDQNVKLQWPKEDKDTLLLNTLKQQRLKFYHLFSQKIQIPKVDENASPILLPLLEISSKGVFIRLPKQLITNNKFNEWLEEIFKNRNIAYKCTDKAGLVPGDFEGMRYVKEYAMSLDQAQELIKDIAYQGIENLAALVQQPDFKIYTAHRLENQVKEPSVEDTISLSLARLDGNLHEKLGNVKYDPDLHAKYPLPVVNFDLHGMAIKIPESCEHLKDIIKPVIGLKNEEIEETHFNHKYNVVFHISRDDIPNFLILLGMKTIEPEGLSKHFEKGDVTYLQHLIETERYHAYAPVKTNDFLESITKSLGDIVPNENREQPFVVYHPRGWISIKFEKNESHYDKNLAAYLDCQLLPIDQKFNNKVYTSEIVIHDENIVKFLKKLQLEKTPEGISLQQCLGKEALCGEISEKKLDLSSTIARTLGSLNPFLKELLETLPPSFNPESIDIILPQIFFNTQGLDIEIPQELYNQVITIAPQKTCSFGDYLANVFSLEVEFKEKIINRKFQDFYALHIPQHHVKKFLEYDLGLRLLPENYKKDGVVTFYNLYCKTLGLQNKKRGSIANLKLRNPPLVLPKEPDVSDQEIIKIVSETAHGNDAQKTINETFTNIVNRLKPDILNPWSDYSKNRRTAEQTREYLSLIIHEFKTNQEISSLTKIPILNKIVKKCNNDFRISYINLIIQKRYHKLVNCEIIHHIKTIFKDEKVKIRLRNRIGVMELCTESYVNIFIDIINRITPGKKNPDIYEYNAHQRTAEQIRFYLKLIINEFNTNEKISLEKKHSILSNIAVGCAGNVCIPGKFVHIQEQYQRLLNPEYGDNVKVNLLRKVEEFKNNVISDLFKDVRESMHVHVVTEIKNRWGAEFGLEQNVIDDNRDLVRYIDDEYGKKQEFLRVCENNLLQFVADSAKEKDNNGAILSLAEYHDRVRKILTREGLKPSQINDEINRLFPEDDKGVRDITREAVEMLLIDIGVLNP